jgi:RNA polymerase sigma-70 factor (ECF subfamily)
MFGRVPVTGSHPVSRRRCPKVTPKLRDAHALPWWFVSDKPAESDPADAAFRRHHDDVYRYLLRRTGSHLDAEELTQRVYLDAASALRRERPRSILAWLYAVAERRFIDEVRRRSRTQRADMPDIADPRQEAALTYGPLTVQAISRALRRLSDDDRRIVVMHLLEGQPFAAIAAELAISEAAAKMRFSRALRRLRDDLTEEGIEP